MCIFSKSRRRMFYVHCPMCDKLLDRSERQENEIRCEKCNAKLRISLIPGLLLVKFDSKLMKSPDFDGNPMNDRRAHSQPAVFYM